MILDLLDFRNLLLILLVFAPLERLIPHRGEQPALRKGWVSDVLHYFLSGILIKLGVAATLAAAVGVLSGATPGGLRDAIRAWPLWAQTIGVIVVADLGFYAAHRTFHAVPWLWRFHAVHHSIEDMDWLAAHRVHPVDQIATKTASLVPVFCLGFSDAAIAAFAVIYHWQALLIHSNVNLPFGPLRWVLASPQFHHWHHANERAAYDRNFAGQLPLWDLVFGTLNLPRAMPTRYGVDDPVPGSWPEQILYPVRPRRVGRAAGAEGAPAAGVGAPETLVQAAETAKP